VHRLLPILKIALTDMKMMPARKGKALAEHDKSMADLEAIRYPVGTHFKQALAAFMAV
jgi:hypothetical protein